MGSFQLYLASSSPRRADLLKQIGVSFQVIHPEIIETALPGESARDMALRLATEKTLAGTQLAEIAVPVLGADTIVVCNNKILGKPVDMTGAKAMLTSLSGMTHCVITAVALNLHDRIETCFSETMVDFKELTNQEIMSYCHTGEPFDKAGGYGIQGLGAVFVKSIRGSYSGTVGLPLMETAELLTGFGIDCLANNMN
jgi:septum formation protein